MDDMKGRGSAKLEAMSLDDLRNAIGLARESYKIERWWKYGQPQIERVRASLTVTNLKDTGKIIDGLIGSAIEGHVIDLGVFPVGIPTLDGVRLDVTIHRSGH